jgi:hypothetical protein
VASDKESVLTIGPFVGMNDGVNLAGQDATRASYIENMFSPTASIGGDLISRPGVTRLAFTSTITGTASKTLTTITGSGTAFLTELAVGDIIEISSTKMLVTAIASNTSATASVSGSVSSGAITRYAAGIVDGPLLGVYRYAHTDGTIKRLMLARTTSNLASRSAASQYTFLDNDSTGTALTGTVAGFANGATTVTGTGTAFTTELEIGMRVTFAGGTAGEIAGGIGAGLTFRVTAITSNTNMTVHTANTGTGVTGSDWTMTKQSGGIRLVEYDPSATPTLKDRTSATMDNVLLDTSARIYGITFANYLVISDGTNRPRKITSAFVLSNMTDANYAFKGALVQYYGKLFGIDASDAITLRWSDENDPDTGYGTSTSDNSWALRQTSADPLECLVATNDALYCFRTNSIAIITGAANSDFRASGSVDAIQNIGCRSPDGVALIGSSVVFIDQYGRPGRVQPGYGYVPLWQRVYNTIRGAAVSAAQLRAAWCRFDPTTNLVKIGYRAATASTANGQMIVFEPDAWESLGIHKWYSTGTTEIDHAYSTVWEDENGIQRHVIASGATTDVALYIQKTDANLVTSALDSLAADTMVPVTVETPKMGGDVLTEKTFTRLAVGMRAIGATFAGVTMWKSQIKGPYSTAYSTADTMWLGGTQGAAPSAMNQNHADRKAEQMGLNIRGRWIQVKFTNDTAGAYFGRSSLDTVTLVATERSKDLAAY